MEHKAYKSINKSVRKKDSMQLLLGKPVYTDDVTPDDALVVKILRSPHANAIVESINTTQVGGLMRLTRKIVVGTALFEGGGALLLAVIILVIILANR